jgi:hypothetical protein
MKSHLFYFKYMILTWQVLLSNEQEQQKKCWLEFDITMTLTLESTFNAHNSPKRGNYSFLQMRNLRQR